MRNGAAGPSAAAAAAAADQAQGRQLSGAIDGQVCQACAAQREVGGAVGGRRVLPAPDQRLQDAGPGCGCSQRRRIQEPFDIGQRIECQGAVHSLSWQQQGGRHQVAGRAGGCGRLGCGRRWPWLRGPRQAAGGFGAELGQVLNTLRPLSLEELHFSEGAKRKGLFDLLDPCWDNN